MGCSYTPKPSSAARPALCFRKSRGGATTQGAMPRRYKSISSAPRWCRRCSTACSRPGCYGRGRSRRRPAVSSA